MESENDSQSDIAVEGIFDPQNNKNGVLLNPKYNGKSRPTDPFVPTRTDPPLQAQAR
jgi:hypothetical protein